MELKLKVLEFLFGFGLGLGLGRMGIIEGRFGMGFTFFVIRLWKIYQKKRGGEETMWDFSSSIDIPRVLIKTHSYFQHQQIPIEEVKKKLVKNFPILFLRSRCLFRLSLGSLLPHTHQSRLAPPIPQHAIRILRALADLRALDLAHGLGLGDVQHGQHALEALDACGGGFRVVVCADFVGGGVAGLGLAVSAGEED